MKISNAAIDRPRLVFITMLLVAAMTVIAVTNISVQRTPAITKAVVLVAIPFPGAQPTEVEEQITRKIEDALQRLRNVDFISSTSLRGSSITQIMFLDGVDPDQARGDVKDLVDQVRRDLPAGREVQPVVTDIDFENAPVMLVNMYGPPGLDQRGLKKTAEEIQKELEGIEGVANTQLFGGREREIHVDVDLDLLVEQGLTIADFRRVLAAYHAPLPGGSLNTGGFDFQVHNETKLRNVDDIRSIVIRQEEGRVLRVGDVADVQDTYRRLINIAQLDGQLCATLIVNKESDINTLKTARLIKEAVVDLRQKYPHITFSTTRDTSEEISIMFRVLGSSFLFGAMLVLVILAWTMGLRISILVLMAIPLSTSVGLIFLYATGIAVSNMVVFSFILALGMVVDGAIIVAENIHRHIERGEDPVTAAKTGIEEVGIPVIVADLTTVAAFMPMLFVPGMMGNFLSVMPKVVCASLIGSVLVDHFVIPTLAAQWYRKRKVKAPAGGIVDAAETAEARVRPNLGVATRAYVVVLRWALNNRWAVIAVMGLSLYWANLMFFKVGFAFFPPSDRGQFEIKYEMPLGTSIEKTIEAAGVFTVPLAKMHESDYDELVHFVSAIGSSEGLSTRLESDPVMGPEFGSIMVQLHPPLDRDRHESVIIRELREQFDSRLKLVPGLKYSIVEVEEGPPGGYDVAVRLTGDDLAQLGSISKTVVQQITPISGTVDAGTDYRDESPQIVVRPNRSTVGMYGFDDRTVSQAIQTVIHGDTSIQMSIDDEDVTLRLQAARKYQQSRDRLLGLTLLGPNGKRATIGELASLDREMGLYSVNRYKRNRAVVAKCNVELPTSPDDVFKVLRAEILPQLGYVPVSGSDVAFIGRPGTKVEGTRAIFTGENEERDKNFSFLLWSMISAVVLIFAILVMQFNSFRQAIIVLFAVPMSFVGVVAGMWLCDFPFSLASFIGLVALTGIVVNDAIVVVDFINQAIGRGLELKEAIVEAGINRLRPVLLTTVTTIGGLFPLFRNWSGGAEFWQPLTGAIIFGLAFATVLTLVVVPVAYSLAYRPLGWGGASIELGSPGRKSKNILRLFRNLKR